MIINEIKLDFNINNQPSNGFEIPEILVNTITDEIANNNSQMINSESIINEFNSNKILKKDICTRYMNTEFEAIVMESNRFKNKKWDNKDSTMNIRSVEEKVYFQKQENERYKNPHLPWIYKDLKGNFCLVSAVFHKANYKKQLSKPRDHELMKSDRPSFVTVLSITKDAAARLTDSVGTLADIVDLALESNFVNLSVDRNDVSALLFL